jgi:hypothetical protein
MSAAPASIFSRADSASKTPPQRITGICRILSTNRRAASLHTSIHQGWMGTGRLFLLPVPEPSTGFARRRRPAANHERVELNRALSRGARSEDSGGAAAAAAWFRPGEGSMRRTLPLGKERNVSTALREVCRPTIFIFIRLD